jgi:hypothetical protein
MTLYSFIELLSGAEQAFKELHALAAPVSSFDPMLEVEQLMRMRQGLPYNERYYPLPYDTPEHRRRVLADYHTFAGLAPGEAFPSLREVIEERNPLLEVHHYQPQELLRFGMERIKVQQGALEEYQLLVRLGGAQARQVKLFAERLLEVTAHECKRAASSIEGIVPELLSYSGSMMLPGRAFYRKPRSHEYQAHWTAPTSAREKAGMREAVELSQTKYVPLEIAYYGPGSLGHGRDLSIRRGNVLESHSDWFRVAHHATVRSYSYQYLLWAHCYGALPPHDVQEEGAVALKLSPARRFSRTATLKVTYGRVSEVVASTAPAERMHT